MIGDLTPDQERYAAVLTERTGLNPYVVRAWVGVSSGWGVNRPGHDYIGRGIFPTADQAARHVAKIIRTSDLRGALPQGQLVQLRTIGQHPDWPGTNDELVAAWAWIGAREAAGEQLVKAGHTQPVSAVAGATP